MGIYNSGEVCEFFGSFLIYELSNKDNQKDIGLYQDDSFNVFENESGSQVQRIKKRFSKNFPWNLKIVNYLDVTLNLLNKTYKPLSKPNNEINCIH